MTARDDLLRAAAQLEASGRAEFSPAQLIAEARTMGSAYTDETLRSMIVYHLKVEPEQGRAPQGGGFVRVGHGLYRRVGGDGSPGRPTLPAPAAPPAPSGPIGRALPPPSAAPVPMSPPGSPSPEWYWEGNVQSAVVGAIAADGWRVRRVSDTSTKEHGIDIEAERDGRRLLIEVKGYPGSTRVRGDRAGELKDRNSLVAQARAYFSGGILAGLIMRADHPGARVVVAFPRFTTYENLSRRLSPTLARVGIEVWLVGSDGGVVESLMEQA